MDPEYIISSTYVEEVRSRWIAYVDSCRIVPAHRKRENSTSELFKKSKLKYSRMNSENKRLATMMFEEEEKESVNDETDTLWDKRFLRALRL